MIRFLIALILCSMWMPGAGALSDGFDTLDGLIADAKTRTDMQAGTAVILLKDGEVVHESYFGMEDITAATPAGPQTSFYIASTTKAYLSLAVLVAEARGEIATDMSLQELFPTLIFEKIDAEMITVRDLLTHTSGIDNHQLTWAMSYTGLHDRTSRLAMIAGSYPDTEAERGTFKYSNIGYNILAVWFDEQYGQDWRYTLSNTVLSPLGLKSTTGFISEAIAEKWQVAEPYSYKVGNGTEPLYLRKVDNTMYSVGLLSTARDAARFIQMQMNEGKLDDKQVIPAGIITRQQERQVLADGGYFDGYAWGWMTGLHRDHQKRFHTGGFPGASVSFSFLPKEDVGVVVIHNESGLIANNLNGLIENAAYDVLLGLPEEEWIGGTKSWIDDLEQRTVTARNKMKNERTELAALPVNLSSSFSEYIGEYAHPLAGSVCVRKQRAHLELSWGQLKGKALGRDEMDSVLVEFIPGDFEPVHFRKFGPTEQFLEVRNTKFTKVSNAYCATE